MATSYAERPGRFEIAIGEELDFTIDYNDPTELYLGDDTLQSSAWVIGDGLAIDSTAFTDTTATVWVSIDGAVAGATIFATNTVQTAGGRTAVRELELVVTDSKP